MQKKSFISSVKLCSWFACKYRMVFAVFPLFKTLPVICFDFDIELDKNKHKLKLNLSLMNLFSLKKLLDLCMLSLRLKHFN